MGQSFYERSDTLKKEITVDPWTGDMVGRMHNARITLEDMAKEMGCTKGYVSMILNGARSPKDAQERFESAFDAIMSKRNCQNGGDP